MVSPARLLRIPKVLLAIAVLPAFAGLMHPVCAAKHHECGRTPRIAACCCGDEQSARAGENSHFDDALDALMLLAYVALSEGDEVGAMTFGTAPGESRDFAPRNDGPRDFGDYRDAAPRGHHGDRPHGDRPHGDRPYGDRPQGDQRRPQWKKRRFGGGNGGGGRGRAA